MSEDVTAYVQAAQRLMQSQTGSKLLHARNEASVNFPFYPTDFVLPPGMASKSDAAALELAKQLAGVLGLSELQKRFKDLPQSPHGKILRLRARFRHLVSRETDAQREIYQQKIYLDAYRADIVAAVKHEWAASAPQPERPSFLQRLGQAIRDRMPRY
jgi:hypothetical protein